MNTLSTNIKANWLTIILLLGAIALLIPGITQPMLTITGTMDKAKLKDTGIDILVDSLVGERNSDPNQQDAARTRVKKMINGVTYMLGMSEITGRIQAYQKTRSILGTVKDLFDSGNQFVAFLVMFFSVIIPSSKILMTLTTVLLSPGKFKYTLSKINALLSKWSMADVFVVALIVTYMAANASSGNGLLEFQSNFEAGFYFFLAYCIFSIAAAQVNGWWQKRLEGE